jgi:glycosyltransferase involved in cell wall biosynthesis
MQINAIHVVNNKTKCPIGGAGIVGQMLQNATSHKINWINNDVTQIKKASISVVYQLNKWPWLTIPRICHVITEVIPESVFIYKDHDMLVTVAEHTWKMFRDFGYKTELIENVARPSFSPGDKDVKLIRDVPILIYCGNFSSHKGTDKLIEAVKDLKCELWLIGKGNINKSKYRNVKFLGIKNENEIIKHLRSADIFVFPSITEGMSLALLEAMAVGLPCIVTNIQANIDTCKDSAIYVDRDILSLRNGIIKLIESKQLQKDLSGTALQIASTRKYEIWGESFISIIENILK